MLYIAVGIFFIVITLLGIFLYRCSRERKLLQRLKLELDFNTPRVNRGSLLQMNLHSRPDDTFKTGVIEGTLTCKQFRGYRGDWLDWTDIPIITRGEALRMFEFTLGENLIFLPGTDNKYEMAVPIPSDAIATDSGPLLQVHWMVRVRVNVPGHGAAAVSREVIVTDLHPQMVEAWNNKGVADVQDTILTRKRKNQTGSQVILTAGVNGDTVKDKTERESSFSFLELEGEKSDDS